MTLVPTSLRVSFVTPLTLKVNLLLLLLNLLLNFLNLLNLLLLIVLQFSFTPLRVFWLVSHLRWVWVYIQFNWILRGCWLIVCRHLFLTLILLNFLNFIVCSLINFILRLRSFLNLIRKNNMRMFIRRLVVFWIVDLTLVLLSGIIILIYHLGLSVLITLKTDRVSVSAASSCTRLTTLRFFLRRNFLLT